jgi:glycosyltransferase involved in cell wall biosynthesis
MKEPLVTVLLPTYNCVRFIDEAVDSIVKQSYKNLEIIIIDDCSTDGTWENLKIWAEKDCRIQIISKRKNSGYVDSLNEGIRIAKGDYIARMDGDDISVIDRISRQVEFMEGNLHVGVLGTGYQVIGTNKQLIPQTTHDKIKIGLLLASQMAHPSVMFRRSVFSRIIRLYEKAYMPAEDYEFWTFLSDKTLLQNLKEPLVLYRIHDRNISSELGKAENKLTIIHNQLSNLYPDVDMEFSIFFSQILNKNFTKYTISSIRNNILILINLKNQNRVKKIYDIKEFDLFISNLLHVVLRKTGRKKILFAKPFSLPMNFVIIKFLICAKSTKWYDFCQLKIIENDH